MSYFNRFLSFSLLIVVSSCGLFSPSAQKTTTKSLASAPFDAVIVPGVPFNDSTWSETMEARVKWSNYLYQSGFTKNVIYSGSAVYSEYTEAKIMALYAIELGIPKENIYIDDRAEHSTENVYYSYQIAKKEKLDKIALATDPFQTNSLRSFIKKFDFPIALIPILYDTLLKYDYPTPLIDPVTAKEENFVSIVERESFGKRLKGTMGQNIQWQEEDLKTKHLRRKYSDRIEGKID